MGTEQGTIHRCSRGYGSDYLATYAPGHALSVYALKWNELHPRLFLSAGADWRVQLWEADAPDAPLLSWDLGAPVGDVAWAPYSSTVFAAATDDGRVHVYDISVSRAAPLCVQRVAKPPARLTQLAFNPGAGGGAPLLLAGDSRGAVLALKLSPNLRRCCVLGAKPPAGQKVEDLEAAKVEAVMAVAAKSAAGTAAGMALAAARGV